MVSTKACVCACLCACVWKPEQTLNVLLDCSPSYVLRQGLSINLHLTDWLSWLANQLWGFASSVLPPCLPESLRLQQCVHAWLLCGAEDLH